MERKPCVIFDFIDKRLDNGKLSDFEFVKNISHTYIPIMDLIEKLKKNNIQVVTPDQWNDNLYDPKKSFLISALFNERSIILIKKGVIPLLLMCQESPAIAFRFYYNFKKISSYYKHCAIFHGMNKQLNKTTTDLNIYFPTKKINNFRQKEFNEKKLLVLIAANKGVNSISGFIKKIILSTIYRTNIKFLYNKRIEFLKWFSQKYPDKINVYGNGWSEKEIYNIDFVYKGRANDKEEVVSNYKFCLCFENAVFPGYVTEKIFDAMLSDSIPVYCGAKDVNKFIPDNCFININDFQSYEEVYRFLIDMNEEKYNEYLLNIKKYLSSDLYDPFNSKYFVNTIFAILQKELTKNNE